MAQRQMQSPPLPVDESKIIAAWHSPEPCLMCAQAMGIRASQLENAWRRLKLEGKLPDRPRHRPEAVSSENLDGRKHVNAYGEDPLLAALREQHPEKAPQ